jgi:surface protein
MSNKVHTKEEFKTKMETLLKEKMIANANIKQQNKIQKQGINPQHDHHSHHCHSSEKNTTILIYDLPCNDDDSCDTYDIQLPVWGYDYLISWGSGVDDKFFINYTTDDNNFPVITNLEGGRRYRIKIYGKVTQFGLDASDVYVENERCQNIEYLTEVEKIGPSILTYAFLGASSLVKVPKKLPCDVDDLTGMFAYCSSFNYPINCWDVSEVKYMDYMFRNATEFNQPLDKWNTSEVESMIGMFGFTSNFNQPLNSWDVSSVTDMSFMFFGAIAFNQPLDKWNVSSVTYMIAMFAFATSFNQPLFGTNVEYVFQGYNVENVSDMIGMFGFAINFNQPLDLWDVGNVENMVLMFAFAKNFNQPLQNWDTDNVNYMDAMFLDATSFNQPLNSWDVSDVSSMSSMFERAISFNQSLHLWDIRNIGSDGDSMLDYCGMSQYNWQTTLIGWYNRCYPGTIQPTVGAIGLLYNMYYNWQVYGNVDGLANTGDGNIDTTATWDEAGQSPTPIKSLVRIAVEYFTNISGHQEINYDT